MATASLVLGCVSFITWLIPFFGFPVSILGIIFGILGGKQPGKEKMALIGLIISIITLVLTVANSAIGAYKGYRGELFF